MSASDNTGPMVLDVRDLRVRFRTREHLVSVVEGVSFGVRRGEVLGVVGESGSGKSMSMLALTGLITSPNVEITGRAHFGDRDLLTLDAAEVRRVRGNEIAMVFQDPMTSLNPAYRVGWQIAEQIRAHGDVGRRAAHRRAAELLELVGIPDPGRRVDDYPHQFSGGMRQRVMIAMALSCDPTLLIADEPTTALDVTIQAQILDLFRRIRDELGTAIVLVSHDLGVVAGIADRVQVMYGGRIVEEAPTRSLFRRPQHPYTRALLDAIPRLGVDRRERLAAIPGALPAPGPLRVGCVFASRCPVALPVCERTDPVLRSRGGDPAERDACLRDETTIATPKELADDVRSQ